MSLVAGFLILLLCLAGCNPKDVNSVTAQASGQDSLEQEFGSLTLHYLDVGQYNTGVSEEDTVLMLNMVEDVKGRGGSGYVVSKDVEIWNHMQ